MTYIDITLSIATSFFALWLLIIIIIDVIHKNWISGVIYIILFCIFLAMSVTLYIAHIDDVKQYQEIYKEKITVAYKVKKILSINKTKSYYSSYLYGLYTKNSLTTDKKILACYGKFHNIKETAGCVKGKI